MWWTVLTVALIALCGVFLLGAKMWPGRHTLGRAREAEDGLWSSFWKHEGFRRRQ
jgi:hypothetical protein